jgi:hypothetical protein
LGVGNAIKIESEADVRQRPQKIITTETKDIGCGNPS